MSVIHRKKEVPLDWRQLLVPGFITLALLGFIGRSWYLQVVIAPELEEAAVAIGEMSRDRLAPRGQIVDRHGRLLAGVEPEVVLTAVPGIVRRHPEVVDRVAEILAETSSNTEMALEERKRILRDRLQREIDANLWRPYLAAPIFVGASVAAATKIAEAGEDFPGFGVETQAMRYYTETWAMSHILGAVWTPNERDEARIRGMGLQPATYVGKRGIELQYEEFLMGVPGEERLRVDVRRRPIRTLGSDQPQPGHRLVLTLDQELQQYGMSLLNGRRGAIVAIEPSTGEVLALVSAPAYDLNLFNRGISSVDYSMLENDPSKPLLQRAIQSSYAPGSTFKVVTALAAALDGFNIANHTVVCNGTYQVGNRTFRCLGRHGRTDFQRAMAVSCNVFFYDVGMRIGADPLRDFSTEIFLGQRSGLDLPSEARGVIPTAEWFERTNREFRWFPGDTANMSIGQGYVLTTPLQMANVASLVANRGIMYRPHVLRAAIDPRDPENVHRVTPEAIVDLRSRTSASLWDQMNRSLIAVMQTGTGVRSAIPGLTWAGKTGSSQNAGGPQAHSWFIGYAPADNPQIAIAVVAENSGHGSEVAAPIAREMVRRYLLPEPVAPEGAVASATISSSSTSASRAN